MGGDGKQGLRILLYPIQVEVLQVLAGNDDRRILLPDALHKVTDILHSSQVGKKQVKLIQARRRVPFRQKLVRHKREDVEQQGIFQASAGLQKPLHTKRNNPRIHDIGVSVEKFALRPHAHGVQTQEDTLEHLCGVKLPFVLIKLFIFLPN